MGAYCNNVEKALGAKIPDIVEDARPHVIKVKRAPTNNPKKDLESQTNHAFDERDVRSEAVGVSKPVSRNNSGIKSKFGSLKSHLSFRRNNKKSVKIDEEEIENIDKQETEKVDHLNTENDLDLHSEPSSFDTDTEAAEIPKSLTEEHSQVKVERN